MDVSKEFKRYMAHLAQGLGHADRHAGLAGYCTGLMLPLSLQLSAALASALGYCPHCNWISPRLRL